MMAAEVTREHHYPCQLRQQLCRDNNCALNYGYNCVNNFSNNCANNCANNGPNSDVTNVSVVVFSIVLAKSTSSVNANIASTSRSVGIPQGSANSKVAVKLYASKRLVLSKHTHNTSNGKTAKAARK